MNISDIMPKERELPDNDLSIEWDISRARNIAIDDCTLALQTAIDEGKLIPAERLDKAELIGVLYDFCGNIDCEEIAVAILNHIKGEKR